MKQILKVFLASCFVLSLAACSANSNNQEKPLISGEKTDLPSSAAMTAPGNLPLRGEGGGLLGESADTSWIKNKETDIAYGTISETQKLDIYFPDAQSQAPYPVIIAVHGGGFMMGRKTGGDVKSMLQGVSHGYAVVSVDYRMSGEAIFPAAISDVKAAIRFIKANAEKYNLDADRIAIWGDSAGGNLAALAGTSGDDDTLNGDNQENLEYSSSVNAVVDWFGPLNFLLMDEQFAAAGVTPKMGKTSTDFSPESKYIGENITQNIEQTKKANPENYITKNDPYFFIQHGSADTNVPPQQSVDFAQKLTETVGADKVSMEIIDGAGHGTSEFDAEENVEKVFEFLDSVLK
ncbi:MAG: alpha/beta hydrolase [Oscillospiraceae bacterium]|nr:alpha/beta hydrolase [Oscillospiraceae bacterium]